MRIYERDGKTSAPVIDLETTSCSLSLKVGMAAAGDVEVSR